MTHDLVIRNGLIYDGRGERPYSADIAVDGHQISAIGTDIGPGLREIDAQNHIVTPGFVDIHTHYDGQVTWDPYLTPSGWHGVTTVVMGNCGVGFAPARAKDRDWLIGLMEGVEDIPGAALSEGIQWSWESFPEYLDALEKLPRALDIATQIPHGALRVYVMGERGAQNEAATAEDIAEMARLVKEAVEKGALGFSTSRTLLHKSIDGELCPGTFAAVDELIGIAKALGESGGVLQMTSNHDTMADEFPWMVKISKEYGVQVSFNLVQIDQAPTLWRDLLKMTDEAWKEGARIYPHVAGRPAGILMGWECTAHPFAAHETFLALKDRPFPEQVKALKTPEIRAQMLAEACPQLPPFETFVTQSFHKMYVLGETPNYEPCPEESVAHLAKAKGCETLELIYDLMLEGDGSGLLYFPLFNYSDGHMDQIREMLLEPRARISLGDGGAHCGAICDASIPTFMLTHWGRDRVRGEKLDLEWIIKRQTWDTASFYGFMDRGTIAEGYKADINIIDFDHLHLPAPKMIHDLPANGRRLVQEAIGYKATIINGVTVFEDGKATGALPGQLLRGRTAAPTKDLCQS
ncbi:MAG: amidohydrolase family protein [Planctomycetota bacterium]|nr:amidohydrolase family protein [Planctomycetota bacterium]